MARVSRKMRPLHPPITDFPVALWVTSLLFDGLSYWLGNGMVRAAFYNMAVGSVLALAAAITGALDYNRIPDSSPARQIGLLHGGLNVVAFTLFCVNLWMRASNLEAASTPISPLVLSIIGVALVGVSAWLGGKMVYQLGVGTPAQPAQGQAFLRPLPDSEGHEEASQKPEGNGVPPYSSPIPPHTTHRDLNEPDSRDPH